MGKGVRSVNRELPLMSIQSSWKWVSPCKLPISITEIRKSKNICAGLTEKMKLGYHMISRKCKWAVLVGGTRFIAFYMKRIWDEYNDLYYHLIVSDCHKTFIDSSATSPVCLSSMPFSELISSCFRICPSTYIRFWSHVTAYSWAPSSSPEFTTTVKTNWFSIPFLPREACFTL